MILSKSKTRHLKLALVQWHFSRAASSVQLSILHDLSLMVPYYLPVWGYRENFCVSGEVFWFFVISFLSFSHYPNTTTLSLYCFYSNLIGYLITALRQKLNNHHKACIHSLWQASDWILKKDPKNQCMQFVEFSEWFATPKHIKNCRPYGMGKSDMLSLVGHYSGQEKTHIEHSGFTTMKAWRIFHWSTIFNSSLWFGLKKVTTFSCLIRSCFYFLMFLKFKLIIKLCIPLP